MTEKLNTLSSFEKLIVAMRLVSGRNDARRLTRLIREHSELFTTPIDGVQNKELVGWLTRSMEKSPND
ncbi:hypothetical protein LJR220_003054 [Bradyrhizobium sp. LjRoot220]|uniref:hypothetical protein n=1 Tax=Bradyrhizobium sp. LjRoot220 TaxID=3342284 RepID=UPI003ECC76FB